jgi:hypothetical protein
VGRGGLHPTDDYRHQSKIKSKLLFTQDFSFVVYRPRPIHQAAEEIADLSTNTVRASGSKKSAWRSCAPPRFRAAQIRLIASRALGAIRRTAVLTGTVIYRTFD